MQSRRLYRRSGGSLNLPVTTVPVDRPRRSTAGSWKDGPAKEKDGSFQTVRDKEEKYQAKIAHAVITRDTQAEISVMKATLKQALKDDTRRTAILQSIGAEIDNLEAPGVLKPVRFQDIPKEHRRDIIGVYMFHREKFKADGTFEKDKTRIVLLSNRRDPSKIGETHCPTVNPISVMTQLNLAAVERSMIAAYDIKGAFLLTPMQQGKRMFIKISGDVVKYWIERYTKRKHWLHDDGCLYFEINRYIYGLHEAPHEFNQLLDKTLIDIGFSRNQADPCAYVKQESEGFIRLSVHVDDILFTCPHNKHRSWFEKQLEKHFPLVKQYDTVSYLGMVIDRTSLGDVTVNQSGYLSTLLQKYGCENLKKTPSTPAIVETFTDFDVDAEVCDQKKYLSLIMSLMFLARFTRPDVLFLVSFLATRCKSPFVGDLRKAIRILHYLAGTRNEGLVYSATIPFVPSISADASHHLYPEGHGQQGLFIFNGSAPVGHRSTKIKMITRSSSESELCGAEEGATYAVWYRLLLVGMGVSISGPITLYQDNKSTIIMAVQGGSFQRTKHLIGRQSYIRERIIAGDLQLKYKPTTTMEADMLTKPLPRVLLHKLKALIHLKPLDSLLTTPK